MNLFRSRRAAGTVLVGCAVTVAVSTMAAAITFSLPTPGKATTVASQVASSHSITTIPANLVPGLASIPYDTVSNTYLHPPTSGCFKVQSNCTFGSLSSKKLVVFLGDSHAWMWLTAVNPPLRHAGYRLQLFWIPSCPAATVTPWSTKLNAPDVNCATWRTNTINFIKSESPHLVILSERTAALYADATTLMSDLQIKTGLATTINLLKSPTTKVAIIGDIPAYTDHASPPMCLSVYPTDVQKCATQLKNPSAQWATHTGAEKAAATLTGATFVDPAPWLCAKGSCSPIIGNMATYFDWSHVTATYGAYLSTVMGTKLQPLL